MKNLITKFLISIIFLYKTILNQTTDTEKPTYDSYNLYDTLNQPFSTIDINNKTITDEILELTQCVCDLTPNSCDYNCCCDLDCPVSLLTKWVLDTSNVCIDKQERTKNSFTTCFDSNFLIQFNLKRGMRDYTQGNLFCVTFDNSSKKTLYYTPIRQLNTALETNVYSSLFKMRQNRFLNYNWENRTESLQTPEYSNYNVDEPIYLREEVNFNSIVENKFRIFKEGVNGECVRSKTVGFLNDIEEQSCGFIIVSSCL